MQREILLCYNDNCFINGIPLCTRIIILYLIIEIPVGFN